MPKYISEEDYAQTQHSLTTLASIVKDMQLVGFINQANLAESIGPILDPTLYREARQQLNDVKALGESLLPFQNEIKRQLKKAEDVVNR